MFINKRRGAKTIESVCEREREREIERKREDERESKKD